MLLIHFSHLVILLPNLNQPFNMVVSIEVIIKKKKNTANKTV